MGLIPGLPSRGVSGTHGHYRTHLPSSARPEPANTCPGAPAHRAQPAPSADARLWRHAGHYPGCQTTARIRQADDSTRPVHRHWTPVLVLCTALLTPRTGTPRCVRTARPEHALPGAARPAPMPCSDAWRPLSQVAHRGRLVHRTGGSLPLTWTTQASHCSHPVLRCTGLPYVGTGVLREQARERLRPWTAEARR
jgi:hypothetical protein